MFRALSRSISRTIVTILHDQLQGLIQSDWTGHETLRTRHIEVGSGALSFIPDWLHRHRPESVDLIVADETTHDVAGAQLATMLGDMGRSVRVVIIDPKSGDDHLVCEDGAIESLRTFLKLSDKLHPIAVGSGTVNDIVKMAAHQLNRPYIAVPTAASMNGYTSAIAAVLSKGVKRTLPAAQPEAIFADIDLIRRAPNVMAQAGFGDLLSKPFSHADWLLSHLIRDVPYSGDAARLLDDAFELLMANADGVRSQSESAMTTLMETLLLSGFSMAMAGTSSPASGGEHLISHYWDMERHCQERPLRALHGTQVGIATRLSSMLFDQLMALEELRMPEITLTVDTNLFATLKAVHPRLTTAVVEEIHDQWNAKQRRGDALRDELALVQKGWGDIRKQLMPLLLSPAEITDALRRAGCSTRGSEIGVHQDELVRTLQVCRHIRSRYVALDLMADLALLEPWSEEIAKRSESDDQTMEKTS